MGCLFALMGGLFPRLALLILWIARPALVGAAFNTFLLPLLGFIFLPFATLIYVIVYTPGVGLIGFDWFWVILAVLLDISHWRPATPNATSSQGYGERGKSRQGSTLAWRQEA